MCDYCKGNLELGYDSENDGIGIEVSEKMAILSGGSWEVEIKYCPICGEKLVKDD